jgi:hypothetical protein
MFFYTHLEVVVCLVCVHCALAVSLDALVMLSLAQAPVASTSGHTAPNAVNLRPTTTCIRSGRGWTDVLPFWLSTLCVLNAGSMECLPLQPLSTMLSLTVVIHGFFMTNPIGHPPASLAMTEKQPQRMADSAIEGDQGVGGSNIWTHEHLTALRVLLTRLGNWGGGVYSMALYHLRALQILYYSGEISRQAMKTVRGQLLSARNEAEMEQILHKVIRNVGIRHKKARQGV